MSRLTFPNHWSGGSFVNSIWNPSQKRGSNDRLLLALDLPSSSV